MSAVLKKFCLIISKLPVYQSGIRTIIKENFPEYEVVKYSSVEALTSTQLDKANLIIIDLRADHLQEKSLCERYYALMNQYKESRWIFMVSQAAYPFAIEYLLRPASTLLSEAEPVPQLVNAIRKQSDQIDHISMLLLSPDSSPVEPSMGKIVTLTHSERQVLRLLAKGWAVNQIAMLLKKSHKTVSAQKNSAMRRLALRGNAEMYAWLNSTQGMKVLNLLPIREEPMPWKITPQKDMSLS
ncbi:LuxR C-terminal-related transcriptional regulator [Scandinavium sp. NPDC088450]|uniref:helix-turn-helix transcriptional regulator n=1 Tax=Scandinavium sp. NPDC088450 TaxID=3364514 RepID=UPI00384C54A4